MTAFAVDARDGRLTRVNTANTGGRSAQLPSIHPSGRWLVVPHADGLVSVLTLGDDAGVALTQIPQGVCPSAVQAVFDRAGTHLFVACPSADVVMRYDFVAGRLITTDPPSLATPSPRRITFGPGERVAYVLSEHDSTITWLRYDAVSGSLSSPRVINAYQTTPGASAHLAVHPAGGWLYVSNRDENTLGVFVLDAAGGLHPRAFESELLSDPADFDVDPSGEWLMLTNHAGAEDVLVYRIDPRDGSLARTQREGVGGHPTFAGVIALPGR